MKPVRTLALAALFALPAFAATPAYALDSTMTRIKATKTILLGYRGTSAPFSSAGADGKPVGYSIELCKRAADGVRDALKLKSLNIKWVPVSAEDRFKAIKSGKIDLECGVTTNTLTRQKDFDFSLMTFADGANILAKSDSGIDSVLKVGGKKVAVIPSTTTDTVLRAGLPKRNITAELVAVKDHAEGIEALKSGKVDAYAADQVVLMGLAGADAKAFKLGNELFSYEPYGLMMRRAQPDFKLAVDGALARQYRDPSLVALYRTYFGQYGEPSALLQAMYTLNGLPE
jgi:ABC-type amino acid transport substrate-binding protein